MFGETASRARASPSRHAHPELVFTGLHGHRHHSPLSWISRLLAVSSLHWLDRRDRCALATSNRHHPDGPPQLRENRSDLDAREHVKAREVSLSAPESLLGQSGRGPARVGMIQVDARRDDVVDPVEDIAFEHAVGCREL